MDTVFVSSVQSDFGDIREAVARAIEALGVRPLMVERAPAASRSPKGALLELVRSADAMVLIIGARHGYPPEGGTSPTEDEFDEAVRAGKPVLVLVQDVEREVAQDAFLARVRGTWGEEGVLTASFDGAADVGLKAISALTALERQTAAAAIRPDAEQRASDLARVGQRAGFSSYGTTARVALVPLVDAQLIDDVTLNRGGLDDRLILIARDVGLISQRLGVESIVNGSAGIALQAGPPHSADSVSITVDRRGAIVVESNVEGTGSLGSMLVDPDRLREASDRAGAFAGRAWSEVDASQQIAHACATVGLPGAQNRVYGRTSGSSISMGGAMRLPGTVVAPDPALLVRRVDVGNGEMTKALLAAVERIFRDADAVADL
jgi:hypothetical protein